MRVGSLFSGIAGLDIGLERAGMTPVWMVEKDEYARRVLRRHFPDVKLTEDVKEAHAERVHWWGKDEGGCKGCLEPVDLICGGFPCQDISLAGKGKGLEGERSGLWREFARIIGEVRPSWVVVENVPALRRRGLGEVLRDLSALGFDATWDCLPASAFGAHHERDRLFVVAWDASNPKCHPVRFGTERSQWEGWRVRAPVSGNDEPLEYGPVDGWEAKPALARVGNGLPAELDRTRCLGNAVVPQVGEYLGRLIMEAAR